MQSIYPYPSYVNYQQQQTGTGFGSHGSHVPHPMSMNNMNMMMQPPARPTPRIGAAGTIVLNNQARFPTSTVLSCSCRVLADENGNPTFIHFGTDEAFKLQRKRPLTDFWKNEVFNSNHQIGKKKSKKRADRGYGYLKRLQKRHVWKLDKSHRRDYREAFHERKTSRREFYAGRRRPITPAIEKCKLWNCPRKLSAIQKMRCLRRVRSSSSVLSDMSRRSRSPIRSIRRSPLLDNNGFEIPY